MNSKHSYWFVYKGKQALISKRSTGFVFIRLVASLVAAVAGIADVKISNSNSPCRL